MGLLEDKLKKISGITDKINAEYKKQNPEKTAPTVFVAAGNEDLMDFGVQTSGLPNLDNALGGGYPKGYTYLIAGEKGVGKSRGAMDMIAANQKEDPAFIALWANFESSAIPIEGFIQSGIDLNRLLITDARGAAERTLNIIASLLYDNKTFNPHNILDAVVIDSITAMVPNTELENITKEGYSKDTVGRQAAMFSKMLRVLNGTGALGKTNLYLIDQVRVGMQYGNRILPGGKAIEHYPKIIVVYSTSKADRITKGQGATLETLGHKVTIDVEKNNSAKGDPHKSISYDVYYGVGADIIQPLVDTCVTRGIVNKGGAWWNFLYGEELIKMNGMDAVRETLKSRPELYEYLKEKLTKSLTGETEAMAPAIEEIEVEEVDEV